MSFCSLNDLSPMRTLSIHLPSSLDLGDKEAKMAMASKLYELGKLTLGQAADLAGYSKETFMELLAGYGVSHFNYSPEELGEDIKNAESYEKAPRKRLL